MFSSRTGLVSESFAYFEAQTNSVWSAGSIGAFLLRLHLVTTWPSSADSRIETSSLFFLEFFVTSDVCTTGGWVGAVIRTPGAIHDGSGGRHSALFTPGKVIRIFLFHCHCTRQLSERYNFGGFDLSYEALLYSFLYYIRSNATCHIFTVAKVGRLCGDQLKANSSNV